MKKAAKKVTKKATKKVLLIGQKNPRENGVYDLVSGELRRAKAEPERKLKLARAAPWRRVALAAKELDRFCERMAMRTRPPTLIEACGQVSENRFLLNEILLAMGDAAAAEEEATRV